MTRAFPEQMKALQDISVQDLPVAGYPRHWGSPRRGSTWGRRWASWRRWWTLGRSVSKTSLSSPLPGSPLRREFHNSSKSLWGKKSCFINFAAFCHVRKTPQGCVVSCPTWSERRERRRASGLEWIEQISFSSCTKSNRGSKASRWKLNLISWATFLIWKNPSLFTFLTKHSTLLLNKTILDNAGFYVWWTVRAEDCLESNRGPLEKNDITLPTAPQRRRFVIHLHKLLNTLFPEFLDC